MDTVYRKENKYIIPLEQAISLRNKLDWIMERDQHGNDGRYLVRSQYYDSITNQDLLDNLSGMWEKRKIRLRTYSEQSDYVKLEYKCKSGSDGVKHSLQISKEEAAKMENREFDFLLSYSEELALRLYLKMTQYIYSPRAIVQYERLAYTYPVSDTRITFDSHTSTSTTPYGFQDNKLSLIPIQSQDRVIVEVKYNDFLPTPIKNCLIELDTSLISNSKYSQARIRLR